ncbi:MAG: SUMF1/EgtB/PvdO family nonheme iron enzyme, partial [Dehalococcoidia bacterium]
SDLTDEQFLGPRLAIVNPPRWEVGHVAWFNERWTLRNLYEAQSLVDHADEFYNSAEVAHDIRWALRLPSPERTLAYLREIPALAGKRLHDVDASERDAYFFRLGAYHSDMHTEAFTYTRQTLGYPEPSLHVPQANGEQIQPEPGFEYGDVLVPGGVFMLGATPSEAFVFDNEKWQHPVEIAPFRISKTAVTNGEFLAFVEAGGYQRREFWSEDGWAWRRSENAERPVHWERDADGQWLLRRYDQREPLRDSPNEYAAIIHVNWHEASAYCAWAGRRLPTEAEWEAAASAESGPDGALSAVKRRFPWGNELQTQQKANLDWMARRVIDVRALPDGDSAFGCRQMIGNVWEWTS